MIEVLKSIHLISLLLGGAASIGNAVLLKRVAAAGGPPPAMVSDAIAALSKMGLGAIVILWLTGLPLVYLTDAFLSPNWIFAAKLVAATLVLGILPYIGWYRQQIGTGKKPGNAALLRRLSATARISTVLAIILAVFAFN